MLRKCFLVPVLGCLTLLAVAVDFAQAQGLRGRRMERREMRRGYVGNENTMSTTPTMAAPTVQQTETARISYYYTPPANENLNNVAQIRMILPDPQAKVYFDEKATTSVGPDRLFTTPALQTGTPNKYRVRISFMQNGQEVVREQVLSCAPNMTYVVDFTRR